MPRWASAVAALVLLAAGGSGGRLAPHRVGNARDVHAVFAAAHSFSSSARASASPARHAGVLGGGTAPLAPPSSPPHTFHLPLPPTSKARRIADLLQRSASEASTHADGQQRPHAMVSVTHTIGDADNEYVVASGHVAGTGAGESEVMLKGTPDAVYGWMTLVTENVAYEYTTSREDGVVHVEEVPLEKIAPVCGAVDPGDDGGVNTHANTTRGGPHRRSARVLGVHERSYRPEIHDLRYLQSSKGAPKVLYMNLDAFYVNKGRGDEMTIWPDRKLSLTESRAEFYEVWQVLSAGLSMYDINVVTDARVWERARVQDRGELCYFNETGRSSARLHSFGTDHCSKNYVSYDGPTNGRIALHEAGHMLGLIHDGSTDPDGTHQEYMLGFAEFKWVPVMGDQYQARPWTYETLYQFSKGEYTNATCQEDDFAIMDQYLTRIADDVTGEKALRVRGEAVLGEQNRGKITFAEDSDAFWFYVGEGGGFVELDIARTEHPEGGGMIDVDATLVDEDDNVLNHSNPRGLRDAHLTANVSEGFYNLVVRGGAEGTPAYGFTTYGSLGNYAINGTIRGVVPPGRAPKKRHQWGLVFLCIGVVAAMAGTLHLILTRGSGEETPSDDKLRKYMQKTQAAAAAAAAVAAAATASEPTTNPSPQGPVDVEMGPPLGVSPALPQPQPPGTGDAVADAPALAAGVAQVNAGPGLASYETLQRNLLVLTTAGGDVLERLQCLPNGHVQTDTRAAGAAGTWQLTDAGGGAATAPTFIWRPYDGAVLQARQMRASDAHLSLVPPAPAGFCPSDARLVVVPMQAPPPPLTAVPRAQDAAMAHAGAP